MTSKISTGGVRKGRIDGTKVVTANSLHLGLVVYRCADGTWTEDLAAALRLEGEDALDALAAAKREETLIVGPYLMDGTDGRETAPAGRGALRESIRLAGPTTRPDHGRQASGPAGEIR